MSHSNGKITSPISLHDDVYEVLGIAPSGEMYDVAEACTSGKINKWSFKKPIRVSQFTEVTDEQIMQNHCGLALEELSLLRVMVDGYQDVNGNYSKNEVLDEVKECVYIKPNEYYRLTDFEGYNHKALPSDKDWADYSYKKSDLTAIENEDTSLDPNDRPTNDYTFTISKTLKQMFKFSIFLGGDNDYNYIGSGNADMLPLTYISGNNFIEGEGWRIAYAVHTPYDAYGNSTNKWHLFIGRKVMDTASDNYQTMQGYYPPDMSSNTHAVKVLLSNYDRGVSSFTMIPCLVKNARLSFDGTQSPNYKISQVILDSSTRIYAMPSGTKNALMRIREKDELPVVEGVTVVATGGVNNTWVLGYIKVDEEGPSGTIPVQLPVVVDRVESVSGILYDGKTNVRFKYHALDDKLESQSYQYPPNSGSTETGVFDIPIGSKVSVTVGDKTIEYDGIILQDRNAPHFGGLGFYILPEDVGYFSVDL